MLILEWLVSRGNDGRQLAQRQQELANKIAKDIKQRDQRSQNYNKAAQKLQNGYETKRITYSEGRSRRDVMDRKYLNDRAAYEKDARLYKDEMKNLAADRKALLAGDKDIQTRMVSLGNHWRLRNLAAIKNYKKLDMIEGHTYSFHLVVEDGNDLLIPPQIHKYKDLCDYQFRHVFNVPAGVTIVGITVYDEDKMVSAYPLAQQKFSHEGTYTLTYS